MNDEQEERYAVKYIVRQAVVGLNVFVDRTYGLYSTSPDALRNEKGRYSLIQAKRVGIRRNEAEKPKSESLASQRSRPVRLKLEKGFQV